MKMAEYIEREAAIDAIMKVYVRTAGYKARERVFEAKEAVHRLPVADVAPVVRCKDCKYWQDNNDNYPHEECRWGHGETPDANDFCSYGVRKGGDSDALD